MTEIKTPLEVYKLLEKTNCGACRLPSCLAFAASVVQGRSSLRDCPYVDPAILQRFEGGIKSREAGQDEGEEVIKQLKRQVAEVDFPSAAERLEAALVNGRLAIHCLGKDFLIDQTGDMVSECHVNRWVLIPLLHYVIHCKGKTIRDDWVAFGDLRGAADWRRFFSHRCEDALRQLADAHTDIVFEILRIFGARPLEGFSSADHSLVIRPLPRVPLLICYWQPEDGLDSKLNILFDRSAEANATPQSLYLIGRGIVEMFRQLIVRHSRDGKLF
jgi:hypothetical protein